jgi:ankyrin repeat protein
MGFAKDYDRTSAALAMRDAINFNDVAKVKALLGAGFDPQEVLSVSVIAQPALEMAAVRGFKEVCALLIAAGADVNYQTDGGNSPMFAACAGGHIEVCKLLAAAGARIDTVYDYGSGITLLEVAVRGDLLATCEWLLQEGADPNAPNVDRFVPLHWVSDSNPAIFKREMAEALLRAGADPDFRSPNAARTYLTPFQKAVRDGDLAAVEFFEERTGADFAQRTLAGRPLLAVARHDHMLSYLRSRKSAAAVSAVIAGPTPDLAALNSDQKSQTLQAGPL